MHSPNYGLVDRLVHRFAFAGVGGAELLSDLETRFYHDTIAQQPTNAPIFVTALPRAGTTLLLEILSRHPDVITHTYRDMPFVMSPLMWRKLSGRFRIDLSRRERAHSDGLLVGADSPEAFEEVFWLRNSPGNYTETGIRPWPENPEGFRAPLADFIRRLIASRGQGAGGRAYRYASKNNANIARLPALKSAFGDGHILVPVRPPLHHAISLHNQHLRFLDMHDKSAFAESYMRDIGHFEFGNLHRPILFDGMKKVVERYAPTDINYWIGYWICAYRDLARHDGVTFIDMQRFTATAPVEALFESAGLHPDGASTEAASALIRPITEYDDPAGIDSGLAREAEHLFQQIRHACPI